MIWEVFFGIVVNLIVIFLVWRILHKKKKNQFIKNGFIATTVALIMDMLMIVVPFFIPLSDEFSVLFFILTGLVALPIPILFYLVIGFIDIKRNQQKKARLKNRCKEK